MCNMASVGVVAALRPGGQGSCTYRRGAFALARRVKVTNGLACWPRASWQLLVLCSAKQEGQRGGACTPARCRCTRPLAARHSPGPCPKDRQGTTLTRSFSPILPPCEQPIPSIIATCRCSCLVPFISSRGGIPAGAAGVLGCAVLQNNRWEGHTGAGCLCALFKTWDVLCCSLW
jgi:hypothetical protein